MGAARSPRTHRVPVMMSEEELTAIDDWRFENRIATRSEAIRQMINVALAIPTPPADIASGEIG